MKNINLNDIVIEGNTRKTFNDAKLRELASSIKEHGVLQPIVVKDIGNNKFGLIAGERRVRASMLCGFVTIPAVVRAVSDSQHLEQNLVENLQREQLPYFETALGIRRLRDESDLTVKEISNKIGKSESLVWGYLLLTKVPDEVQSIFQAEEINSEVAVLIAKRLSDPMDQIAAARALRRSKKDKRIQRRSAEAYLAETFGVKSAIDRRLKKQSKASKIQTDYRKNWKKYLVRFDERQFTLWKKWVAGRIDTEILADAVENVMLETMQEGD